MNRVIEFKKECVKIYILDFIYILFLYRNKIKLIKDFLKFFISVD